LTQRSISKPTLVEYSVTGDVFPRALDGDVLASLTDVQTELKLVIELIAVLRPADLRFIEGQPLVVRLPLADSNIMP